MGNLFADLDFVRTYIDDLLTVTKGFFAEHLQCLKQVLKCLRDRGLKINVKKSFFDRDSLKYLEYWVTRNGIQPLPDKVQALQDIAPFTTKKQLRRFMGLVNYYRDM